MTDIASEFIWRGFENQYTDLPEPATERMMEPIFKRNYTVFRVGHFATRIIELDKKFQLPNGSILHVADNFEHWNNPSDLPDVANNVFMTRETYKKYIYHVTALNTTGPIVYEDKYILRMAGLPSKLMQFRIEQGNNFKYVLDKEALPTKREALIVVNHNPIFRMRLFGRMQFFRKFQQMLASILNTCCELSYLNKNQFLMIPWGTNYYDKAEFIRSRTALTMTSVKHPEDLQYLFMLHLINFLHSDAVTSMLSKLPDEVLSQLYIVPYRDEKYIFYNLKELKELNYHDLAYRRIVAQLNTLALLSRDDAKDNPIVDTTITETEIDKDISEVNEDTDVESTGVKKVIETVASTVTKDAVSTVADMEKKVERMAEFVKPDAPDTKLTKGINVTPVSIDVSEATATIHAVSKNNKEVKNTKTVVKVNTATNVTDIDKSEADNDKYSKEYVDDLTKDTETFIDNSDLTPAAKNRYKKLATKYKDLTIGGVKLSKLLEETEDIKLTDNRLDPKQLGIVPDESELECTMSNFDKDYVDKTFHKHLAGIITSFQKNGAYLINVKEEKVITDLHNYTQYSCQYEDIRGKKSTVKFKIPNITSNGAIVVDGVPQIIKKQRIPLPIIKISDSVISLSSNYNKTRVVRNTTKAHNFGAYVHSFVNDPNKSNCTIVYGHSVVNLPLSYEYISLGNRYKTIQFKADGDVYNLYFHYNTRQEVFNDKPELLAKLEAEYGVYFGYTKNLWLFINNQNKVSALKQTGGEVVDYPYASLLDVCRLSMKEEYKSKPKSFTEWINITILDTSLPVIFMLAYRYGLRATLDYLGAKYTITENRSKTIVGENEVEAGVEGFNDVVAGDIPSYDDSIEDYSKDTVVCYEGIWKDNFTKRDAHNYDGYKEIISEFMEMLAKINKKYTKDLSNAEAIKYIKEKLYSSGSRLVITNTDLDGWRKQYNLSDEDLINGYCTTQVFGDHYYASSYGKSITPLIEQVIEDEAIALKTVNFARNELYGHEVYHLEHITDHILRLRQHRIHITKEFIDFMLLSRTAHEDGHSAAPKSIGDECLRTHTFDAHEKYADECMMKHLREYIKDILNDKEEEEIVHITPGIRKAAGSIIDNIPHIFGLESFGVDSDNVIPNYSDNIIIGTEALRRPVKPRLGDVTIILTKRSATGDYGSYTVMVRAFVITVNLGRTTSVKRRITNYDSTTFTTSDLNELPRELVDKASAYLRCGIRKISKAQIVWIPADKSIPKDVAAVAKLTPIEFKKLTSKLNIDENKVRPANEDLTEEVKYVPQPNDIHIKFADRVLHFNRYPLAHSLILSGLAAFDLSSYDMSELENKDTYFRILVNNKMSANYLKGIDSFYDLFVDNMTYTVLKMMHEPTNVRDLLIRCAVLLSTTDFAPASSAMNHRIRGYEQLAAIVCNELSREFAGYQSRHNAANVFSVNPDAVYLHIIQNSSMVPYDSCGPLEDIKLRDSMTYAGIGGRTGESFVISDRRYDESDVGVISEAAPDNGKVGLNATLSHNPNIKGTLGIIESKEFKDIKPSEAWSIHALVFPGALSDDTKRVNFIGIQSSHLVPTKRCDISRYRTGYERILAHNCSRNFAGVAEQDGKVTNIDTKAEIIEVAYADGTKDVFSYGHKCHPFASIGIDINLLCDVKVGQKLKKGDVITHNPNYFQMDHDTKQLDYSIGVQANVAMIEQDSTVEDSCEISDKLSDRLSIAVANDRVISLSAKSVIYQYAKIGDIVKHTDNLMIFDEEPTAAASLTRDDTTLAMLAELNRSTPSAKFSGEVVQIDAYYGCEISEMSPTVAALVKQCITKKTSRSKLASNSTKSAEYPASTVIRKGSKYKGVTFDENTVMFIFHIREDIKNGIGDKVIFSNQLKCTCGAIFQRKITTESGVEVDALFSQGAQNRRIVVSSFLTGIGTRILEKLEDDICLDYFGEPRKPD